MNENKILILCMTCNKPKFDELENSIRQTWAKNIIENKISNMKFFFYTAGNKNYIDYENNKIYVNSGDEIYNTFSKTKKCIKLIEKENIEYDYIVRVNTSTFINTVLLNNYISIMKQLNDNRILCTMIVKDKKDNYFPCGKILVFNKQHIEEIMNYKYTNKNHYNDDYIYGKIFLNEKFEDEREIFSIFKVFGEPIYFNWNDKYKYSSNKYSLETIKKYPVISVRSIKENRDDEIVSMSIIYSLLSNIKYNFDDIVDIYFNDIYGLVDDNCEIRRMIRA